MIIDSKDKKGIDCFSNFKSIGIIGASGFLGSKLFSDLSKHTKVIGTYFSKSEHDLEFLDISDVEQVKLFWQRFKPELLLVSGGITYPDKCEMYKEEAFRVNVQGMKNILKVCKCKIIYFSTDYVFDGEIGNYNESDYINPINYYGWTKHEAEKIVLSVGSNIVLRVSGLYGYNERNNEFLKSLMDNTVIYKADDCYSCNLLLDDITNNLGYFINKSGLFHFTDEVPISRYEFLNKAVKILNMPCNVLAKHSNDLYKNAKRPRNSCLVSKKHDFKLCGPEEGLIYLKNIIEKLDLY